MKTAAELYKMDQHWDFNIYDYQPLLSEFGNILIQVDDNGYQGDSRLLYEKDGKYGYLIFGWGSCSGCDGLQACANIEEVQELMDQLHQSIKWFDSLDELQTYFKSKDWELEYFWHTEEGRDFIEQACQYKAEVTP